MKVRSHAYTELTITGIRRLQFNHITCKNLTLKMNHWNAINIVIAIQHLTNLPLLVSTYILTRFPSSFVKHGLFLLLYLASLPFSSNFSFFRLSLPFLYISSF